MNASDPLASALHFAFSMSGTLTLIVAICLFALLWSDQIKRRWRDRVERKKWEYWNGPRASSNSAIKRGNETTER